MMRYLILALSLVLFFSCVKRKGKNPVPTVDFVDFITTNPSGDTATMVLAYEDGDGDLFVDNYSEGPNLIFTTYAYNDVTGTFVAELNTQTQDTAIYTNTVKQPDNGYYKGKPIHGNITIPLAEFRQKPSSKVLKFIGFIIDMKKHKSNVFTSPVYTVN